MRRIIDDTKQDSDSEWLKSKPGWGRGRCRAGRIPERVLRQGGNRLVGNWRYEDHP